MSEHKALIAWKRGDAPFAYESYSRDHQWTFDGGIKVQASAAPDYFGNKALVDPEEALVAAVSSCHMLTFLAVAAKRQYIVESYQDNAVGFMEKNESGKLAVTRIVLRPQVVFGGDRAKAEMELAQLHQRAHDACFIANSVKTDVTVEPVS